MRIAAIDLIDTPSSVTSLPLMIRQSSTRLPAIALLAVSGLPIAGLAIPVGMIAAQAASDATTLNALLDRPASSALLAAGLVVVFALLSIPLFSGLGRLRHRSAVRVARDRVSVETQALAGSRRWEAPISHFVGVTHHIRATLSGARHEIILVHANRDKDVLLLIGTRAPEQGAEHFAKLLGLRVVPATILYGRRSPAPDVAAPIGVEVTPALHQLAA